MRRGAKVDDVVELVGAARAGAPAATPEGRVSGTRKSPEGITRTNETEKESRG